MVLLEQALQNLWQTLVEQVPVFIEACVVLSFAGLLGGVLGLERQVHGRWVGFRTHMSVSMGAALFIQVALVAANAFLPDTTRAVQGIATGIGFIGAGTILKLADRLEVKGLTTASSVWLSAAVGTACGMKQFGMAVAGTLLAVVVLAILRPVEKWMSGRYGEPQG